jgi:Tfp pilus assembly protein PilF
MGQYDKMFMLSKLALDNQDLTHKEAFYYYAGLALLGMGQTDKAFLFFQKSLTINENNPDLYFYMANIYQSQGHQKEAQYFFQASLSFHQKNGERMPYGTQLNLRFF